MNKSGTLFDDQLLRLKDVTGVKTDTDLAKIFGITAGGFSGARRRGNIPQKWFVFVSTNYGVNLEWLISGTGQRNAAETPAGGKATDIRETATALERQNAALQAENAMLKELVAAHQESLRAKDEALDAYRQMLRQAQSSLTSLEKGGVITAGAPAYAPSAPTTKSSSD